MVLLVYNEKKCRIWSNYNRYKYSYFVQEFIAY